MFSRNFGTSDESKNNRNNKNKSTLENFPGSQSKNNSNLGTRISAPNGALIHLQE